MRCPLSLSFHLLDKVRHIVCFGKRLNQIPKCVDKGLVWQFGVVPLPHYRFCFSITYLFIVMPLTCRG